ncbi:MAG: type II secretion system F family protein [Planctomycetes bacterium]|nr:type II secretion system F family protein [Planctomycetota bacterium]
MPEKIIRRGDFAQASKNDAESAAPAARADRVGVRERFSRGKIKARDLATLTRTLATLTDAGLPVVKALTILEGQQRSGPVKRIMKHIVEDVSTGTTLSEAMARHGKQFDRLYINMVRAGEAAGELDRILNQLADYLEKSQMIRDRVKGASIYPAVILVVAASLLTVIFIVVIPKFQIIFDSMQVDLPWQTVTLIDTSKMIVKYWYLFFGIPVALYFAHLGLMRRVDKYRYRMHAFALKLPLIGALLRKILIARFARTFGTLVQSGVPHLEGLDIVKNSMGNDRVAHAVDDVRARVREGEGLAIPMGESQVFDDVVVNLVSVGEATGELDRMLLRVGDAYESDVNRRLEAVFKIFEPALLILMAGVVGFIVVALFLPLLKIMDNLNK